MPALLIPPGAVAPIAAPGPVVLPDGLAPVALSNNNNNKATKTVAAINIPADLPQPTKATASTPAISPEEREAASRWLRLTPPKGSALDELNQLHAEAFYYEGQENPDNNGNLPSLRFALRKLIFIRGNIYPIQSPVLTEMFKIYQHWPFDEENNVEIDSEERDAILEIGYRYEPVLYHARYELEKEHAVLILGRWKKEHPEGVYPGRASIYDARIETFIAKAKAELAAAAAAAAPELDGDKKGEEQLTVTVTPSTSSTLGKRGELPDKGTWEERNQQDNWPNPWKDGVHLDGWPIPAEISFDGYGLGLDEPFAPAKPEVEVDSPFGVETETSETSETPSSSSSSDEPVPEVPAINLAKLGNPGDPPRTVPDPSGGRKKNDEPEFEQDEQPDEYPFNVDIDGKIDSDSAAAKQDTNNFPGEQSWKDFERQHKPRRSGCVIL